MWHQEKFENGGLYYREGAGEEWIKYTEKEVIEKYLNTKEKLIKQVHECY